MIFLTILTLIAASYLSVACFCIIHRMSERTPWSLAIAIITIAALAAYAFLECVAYLSGTVTHITPVVMLATAIAAMVFTQFPRIDTERRPTS